MCRVRIRALFFRGALAAQILVGHFSASGPKLLILRLIIQFMFTFPGLYQRAFTFAATDKAMNVFLGHWNVFPDRFTRWQTPPRLSLPLFHNFSQSTSPRSLTAEFLPKYAPKLGEDFAKVEVSR